MKTLVMLSAALPALPLRQAGKHLYSVKMLPFGQRDNQPIIQIVENHLKLYTSCCPSAVIFAAYFTRYEKRIIIAGILPDRFPTGGAVVG
jgi:hypothetical protein